MTSNDEFAKLFPLDFTDYEVYDTVKSSIENYYYHKLDPGSFVYAMLCNDFVGAVLRADSWNRLQVYQNALWLANRMPTSAWGSKKVVDEWLTQTTN